MHPTAPDDSILSWLYDTVRTPLSDDASDGASETALVERSVGHPVGPWIRDRPRVRGTGALPPLGRRRRHAGRTQRTRPPRDATSAQTRADGASTGRLGPSNRRSSERQEPQILVRYRRFVLVVRGDDLGREGRRFDSRQCSFILAKGYDRGCVRPSRPPRSSVQRTRALSALNGPSARPRQTKPAAVGPSPCCSGSKEAPVGPSSSDERSAGRPKPDKPAPGGRPTEAEPTERAVGRAGRPPGHPRTTLGPPGPGARSAAQLAADGQAGASREPRPGRGTRERTPRPDASNGDPPGARGRRTKRALGGGPAEGASRPPESSGRSAGPSSRRRTGRAPERGAVDLHLARRTAGHSAPGTTDPGPAELGPRDEGAESVSEGRRPHRAASGEHGAGRGGPRGSAGPDGRPRDGRPVEAP